MQSMVFRSKSVVARHWVSSANSGCGKSTLARCLLRLIDVEAGRLEFLGQDITQLDGDELRRVRRHMQPIFQDPYASLNPRRRIADIVAEPLAVNGIPNGEMTARVQEALDLVGLGGAMGSRFPHQLSGGQRQRVASREPSSCGRH